ncbi:MAG TPA: hypothetical protein VME40_12825 [Caulobacteraceae bacterium]|nr:hypothetical protein [Caulobacteraceae bacterium]
MGPIAPILAAIAVSAPTPAPPLYVTENYALAFRTPPHTTICTLPDSWAGSDHGTVIFLTPPQSCGGAGYPSSSRGFTGNVPRIEVYYGYQVEEAPLSSCRHPIASIRFMDRTRPLCRSNWHGLIRLSVNATYVTDQLTEADADLLTTRRRLAQDLGTFRAMAASMRPCQVSWTDNGKTSVYGEGLPCPKGHWF